MVKAKPISLKELIGQVLRVTAPAAKFKGLELTWDASLDADILGDARLLSRILVNLVSNAVEYHGSWFGETPRIETRRDIDISVTDTGPGIPPEKRDLIFENFQRAGTNIGFDQAGFGLGWGCPSAANSQGCSAATLSSAANREKARPSHSGFQPLIRESTMTKRRRPAVDDDSSNIARWPRFWNLWGCGLRQPAMAPRALETLSRHSGPHGFNGIVDHRSQDAGDGWHWRSCSVPHLPMPTCRSSWFQPMARSHTAVRGHQSGALISSSAARYRRPPTKGQTRARKRKLVLDNRRSAANSQTVGARDPPRWQFACHASPPRRDHEVGSTDATVLIHARPVLARKSWRAPFTTAAPAARTGSWPSIAEPCRKPDRQRTLRPRSRSFTDAKQQRRIGVIEYAKGGTLLLDEIESMPVALR